MLRSGTTCVIEAGTIIDLAPVHDGLAEVGIRGRIGQWTQDRAFAPGDDQAALTAAAIARLERELDRYSCLGEPLLAAWPCLVGHMSVTDALGRGVTVLAKERGAGGTAGIHKDARVDVSLFPATRVLECATINGASGAQLSQQIGSLEPGKKGDFVAHDRRRPEWVRLLNVVNQLVYLADGRGVLSVWVDGVRVVADYRSTMIDEAKLFAEVEAAAPAILARASMTIPSDWPVL